MALVIVILICIAVIVLGVAAGKPLGWIALGFALLALLLQVLGGAGIHIGR